MQSGCGAGGSALPLGGRGRGFKSRHSDQTESGRNSRSDSFLLWDVSAFGGMLVGQISKNDFEISLTDENSDDKIIGYRPGDANEKI